MTLLIALPGCLFGPQVLPPANSHYSEAVRIANSEQMLVNLVRLRYRDVPVFLGVTNISTQFEFESALDVNGTIVTGGGSDSVGIGGGVRYSERPTISFSILGGESFQKRMLQPLSVIAIALLAESGWKGSRVLQLTVEKINGLPNAPTASGPTPKVAPAYSDFLEATALIEELARDRLVDFEFETRIKPLSAPLPVAQVEGRDAVSAAEAGTEFVFSNGDRKLRLIGKRRTLVMRFSAEAADSPRAIRLRKLLRLDPAYRRFDVVGLEESQVDPYTYQGLLREIAIDTRSLMGVMYYLSNAVQAPPEDLDSGRVTSTIDPGGAAFDWARVLDGLLRVRWSRGRPEAAALSARHRSRWFYIADDDETSKSTFLLLSQIFSLQAGDIEEVRPVLTLPVGGR